MHREIEVIRYLLDEIEQRNYEILKYKRGEHERFEIPPQRQLIIDNAKKIRQLALKIRKVAESL